MTIITTANVAADIAGILASAGIGTIGTDLFVNAQPDAPDACMTVFSTSDHRPPEIEYNWEYPSVQVMVRRKPGDHQAGMLATARAMDALHGYVGTVGAVSYHGVQVINGPIPMGIDARNRPSWVFNCVINRSI